MHSKPVIVVDPWDDYAHLRTQIEHLVVNGFMRETAAAAIHWTTSVEDAVLVLDRLLQRGEGPVATHTDEALESY